MNLSNQDVQLAQGMYVSSATQQHPLGTRGCDATGRVYRYCRAGAVDLAAGNVVQSAATVAGNLTMSVNATSSGLTVGDIQFTVTCSSAVSTGFYREGFAVIATGSGQGYIYYVNNHPSVSVGANGVFTLYPEDAFVVAITTASKISLLPNLYQNVIVMPVTTATGVALGVSNYVITATQFGWIQTWGPCAVLSDDTTALGAMVNAVAGVCGRASGFTAAGLLTGQILGNLMAAGVAGEWRPVYLKVSP